MTTVKLDDIRTDGGTQMRELAWVEEHREILESRCFELTALLAQPFAIASISPATEGDGFDVRIDWGHSISATRAPVRLEFLPLQMTSLGFDWSKASFKESLPISRGDESGSVYFIQSEKGGLIKIGKSSDPILRLAGIQFMSPVKLCLLGVISGGIKLERRLHRKFAACRAHGEWFHPTDELLSYISEVSK